MNATPRGTSEITEILVLETDRLRGAVIARTVSRVFPTARIYAEHLTSEAAQVLAGRRIDLFLVALRGFDLDVLTLLGVWAQHADERTRLLVMSPDVNCAAMRAVRTLPISAVFDSSRADLRELEFACRAVAAGRPYWCPALAMANAGASADSAPPFVPSRLTRRDPPSADRSRFDAI